MRTRSCSEQAEIKGKCFFNDLRFPRYFCQSNLQLLLNLLTKIFNKLEPLPYHFSKIFFKFHYRIPSKKRVRISSLEDRIMMAVVDQKISCHTISENILENILGKVFLLQKFQKLTFRTKSTPKQFPKCYWVPQTPILVLLVNTYVRLKLRGAFFRFVIVTSEITNIVTRETEVLLKNTTQNIVIQSICTVFWKLQT